MTQSTRIQIFFVLILFLCSAFYAGHELRPQTFDGARIVFNMLNGHPLQKEHNSRYLGLFIQSVSYAVPILIEKNISFAKIQSFFNFYLAFFPLTILVAYLIWFYRNGWNDKIILLLLIYSVSVLSTYPFHVSLVPESILFGTASYISWKQIIFSKNRFNFFVLLMSLFFLIGGHESTFCFAIFILGEILYTYFSKHKPMNFRIISICLLIMTLFTYRLIYFESIGGLIKTAKLLFSFFRPFFFFYFFVSMFYVMSILSHNFTLKINLKRIANFTFFVTIFTFFVLLFYRRESAVLPSYLLRQEAFIFAIPIALLWMKMRSNISYNFSKKVVVVILLTVVVDVKITDNWKVRRDNFLNIFNDMKFGCKQVHSKDYALVYESILFQSTFSPKFIVVPDFNLASCEFDPKTQVPTILLKDKVRTFRF